MKWNEKAEQIAEQLGWSADVTNDEDGYCLFQISSPEGQDHCIELDDVTSLDDLRVQLLYYCDVYDPSEEAYLWLDNTGHGTNGAPYDMKDVYEDMEWCLEKSEELRDAIYRMEVGEDE